MNGIHSRYDELLSKVDISYLAEAILNTDIKSDGAELTYIDAERKALESVSNLSKLLPQEESENLMLEVMDYGVAIQNRYFMYGVSVGAKIMAELGK